MRIDGTSITEGKFQYKVAGDDDSGSDTARIKAHILVNFFRTFICGRDLFLEDEGALWVMAGDWRWMQP